MGDVGQRTSTAAAGAVCCQGSPADAQGPHPEDASFYPLAYLFSVSLYHNPHFFF